MLYSTCTVTGPTVIDFHGQVNSVEDRCSYSLVLTPSVPDFHVLGNFRERRRKDVTFLDSVTLVLDRPSIKIHLEQGGTVRLDNSILTLNSLPQLVHNVELSKDRTGVTAKVSLSYSTISVFFDGYTAQIHLEHRCQTLARGPNLARSLITFGPRGHTKLLLELACRSYTVHVLLILQIPECSVGVLARQSGQDPLTPSPLLTVVIATARILPRYLSQNGEKKERKQELSGQVGDRISVYLCKRQTCLSCMWSSCGFNQGVQH
ncbi:uncharacterized protein LOC143416978 [Maylandia zebra]|uniref:uncharacterized protein LOC143416978 n=1 Tax=Maylandia zebra TaxID=106582 RepID=UPI00403C8E4E